MAADSLVVAEQPKGVVTDGKFVVVGNSTASVVGLDAVRTLAIAVGVVGLGSPAPGIVDTAVVADAVHALHLISRASIHAADSPAETQPVDRTWPGLAEGRRAAASALLSGKLLGVAGTSAVDQEGAEGMMKCAVLHWVEEKFAVAGQVC